VNWLIKYEKIKRHLWKLIPEPNQALPLLPYTWHNSLSLCLSCCINYGK